MKKRRISLREIAMGIIILLVLFVVTAYRLYSQRTVTKQYSYSKEMFGNPLMGYAPCAWRDEVGEMVSLLYVDVTWRELEPEKGKFAWDVIEEENQFKRWKEEGKHFVFRFVCDIPGDETHLDIPDWLYEETGDGSWYDMEYGKGYSLDYGNEDFIRYHRNAVEKMGERWNQYGLLAYIELGSLGHWGEWHVNYQRGIRRIPEEEVRRKYVEPWKSAFPDSMLLMRRPFQEAKRYGTGLFNDMAGDRESTEEWLCWIEEGGIYSQPRQDEKLVPMKEFWKQAPVGGELTSGTPMDELTGELLEETMELIRKSHTTFLGPKMVPEGAGEGYERILGSMGYRLWISESRMNCKGGETALELIWENTGTAPFYRDWPVTVLVKDREGNLLEDCLIPMHLPQILPGRQHKTKVMLQEDVFSRYLHDEIQIQIRIQNPANERCTLRLANAGAGTEFKI